MEPLAPIPSDERAAAAWSFSENAGKRSNGSCMP